MHGQGDGVVGAGPGQQVVGPVCETHRGRPAGVEVEEQQLPAGAEGGLQAGRPGVELGREAAGCTTTTRGTEAHQNREW